MLIDRSGHRFSRPLRRRAGWALHRAARHRITWILTGAIVSVALVAAGGFGYLQYMASNAPAPLSFADAPGLAVPLGHPDAAPTDDPGPSQLADGADGASRAGAVDSPAEASATGPGGAERSGTAPASAGARAELDGLWAVGTGSVAGYRIGYTAVGVRGTRVGRGTANTGTFELSGTTITRGEFSVDFREVRCDGGEQCDEHVQEIMDTENHPFEIFTMTAPIELGSIPAEGRQVRATVRGELTLRGVTQPVSFPVAARRNAGRIEVLGTIPVNRDDYKIPDANQPGFSIDRDGLVEFLLLFDHRG